MVGFDGEAISAGRKHAGQEHWLPLFHDHLDTLFDYAGRAQVFLSPHVDEARKARVELIALLDAPRATSASTSICRGVRSDA